MSTCSATTAVPPATAPSCAGSRPGEAGSPPTLVAEDGAAVEPGWCGAYRCRDATFVVEPVADARTLRLEIDGLGGTMRRTAALEPLAPATYRSDQFMTDPTRTVSFEAMDDGSRLIHAGPFTARAVAGA
jgi:hypothetical protein